MDLHPSLKHIFNSSSEPVSVSVRALPYIPVAKQVTFEPLSTSDWEMIEMEASALEDGGLLNQITIVYPGQVLPLRLIPPESQPFRGIETAAWVKVVGNSCGDGELDGSDSDESDSDSNSSFNNKLDQVTSSESCLRLMAETEVVVIPKPRIKESDKTSKSTDAPINIPSKPLRIQPTTLDYPKSKGLLKIWTAGYGVACD